MPEAQGLRDETYTTLEKQHTETLSGQQGNVREAKPEAKLSGKETEWLSRRMQDTAADTITPEAAAPKKSETLSSKKKAVKKKKAATIKAAAKQIVKAKAAAKKSKKVATKKELGEHGRKDGRKDEKPGESLRHLAAAKKNMRGSVTMSKA